MDVQSFGYVTMWLCLNICMSVSVCTFAGNVIVLLHFQVDLQPSGKVMMSLQFFMEDTDTGKTRSQLNKRSKRIITKHNLKND